MRFSLGQIKYKFTKQRVSPSKPRTSKRTSIIFIKLQKTLLPHIHGCYHYILTDSCINPVPAVADFNILRHLVISVSSLLVKALIIIDI